MLELIEREQLPGDVRSTLAGALMGDMRRQQLLFQAMVDTWPRLQKALREIRLAVRKAPWKVVPWSERGQKPTPKAEKVAVEVEAAIWSMKPDAKRLQLGFEGMIEQIAMGFFFGHQVVEIGWVRNARGYRPKSAKVVPPRFYGYPYQGQEEDRLMLDKEGSMGGVNNYEDFPDHRFLIAINGGHPGHPTISAPLRALAQYWLAAVYGLKWLLRFTEVYGIPWRHVEVADSTDRNVVERGLRELGSNGYIITKPGAKINILDSPKGGTSIPQKVLLDLADEQCDVFILGQTLTSSAGKKGSQALGTVHEGVRQGVIEGVCDFVGEVLTYQLSPSVVTLNYGDSEDEAPGIWAQFEKPRDLKVEAERVGAVVKILGKSKRGVSEAWVYETLGVPMPAKGEPVFIPTPETEEPMPANPGEDEPEDPDAKKDNKDPVEASDAGTTWKPFLSSSGSLQIPRREMPQIRSGDRAAMVQFLRARGIESRAEAVDPASLKPTQAEYSPEKVAGAKAHQGGNRAILISEDGHVVDGHHQWLAAGKDHQIKVIRLMAPIARVLMMVHRMPSTSVAAAAGEGSGRPKAEKKELEVNELSSAVLEGLTGVSAQWLSPVRPFFERLAALAMAKQVTNEDFVAALEKAQIELPELFDVLDTESLEEAFGNAISAAGLSGSVSRYV